MKQDKLFHGYFSLLVLAFNVKCATAEIEHDFISIVRAL